MNSEIQIVTAFFSIDRNNWKGFERSDELYFQYFKSWAKLKNQIIVYTDKDELKERIMAFRAGIGLEEKTRVVLVSDIFGTVRDLFRKMETVSNDPVHRLFRLLPDNPEVWNARYDYVISLKMWCCADAVEKGYADGMVAWMDFGYNHGGSVIDSRSDFNFMWTYAFPEKINIFLLQDLDNRPLFDIIASMDTYVMGSMIVAPAQLWGTFWRMMKDNMEALARTGIIDDDQSVILMCMREHPELFNTYKSTWFLPLKQFGGEHLILKADSKNRLMDFVLKQIHRIKHRLICAKYAYRIFRHMKKIEIH
jgi:protein YibB